MTRIDIDLVEGDVSSAVHTIVRLAAKAVVMRDGELLMLRSRYGDYKFPGGGHEAGETPADALTRELREECGLTGARIAESLVRVRERRLAREPDTVFSMVSDYFRTHLHGGTTDRAIDTLGTDLDLYEQELGLTPEWVAPDVARDANRRLLAQLDTAAVAADLPWLDRETRVLSEILRLGPA